MRLSGLLILILGSIQFCFGQGEDEVIKLNNASFEDIRRHSHVPSGWYNCGFITESEPDVQPGFFDVTLDPKDGMSYLGMVVRENETWEAVAQELSQPLVNNSCYEFSISLARSDLYLSPSRTNKEKVNHLTPVKLRIWAGNDYCSREVLLAESILVKNYRWVDFSFKLEAIGNSDQYSHIIFEAYYKQPSLFPYNGNILLDNASVLKLIPCDETQVEDPIAILENPAPQEFIEPNPPRINEDEPNTPDQSNVPVNNTEPSLQTVKEPATLAGIEKPEKGQIIRLDKLFFEADKADIKKSSNEILDEVYYFLAQNGEVSIEIGGHTNDTPPHWYCDSLSTARAKAVADYLYEKGIQRERLQFKGYGKRQPLFSNRTSYGRKRNQRVEIKVLDIG